jgi:hypothetical protein
MNFPLAARSNYRLNPERCGGIAALKPQYVDFVQRPPEEVLIY